MSFDRKVVFDTVRVFLKNHDPNFVTFTQEEVRLLDNAITVGLLGIPKPDVTKPSTSSTSSGFVLGEASKQQLKPLHPKLKQCVELAIKYTLVDFKVLDVERTVAEQRELVRKGASKTMKSKHLRQADGFVHAVDLGALVNGKVSWDFEHYYYIARAMDRAATELGVAGNIRWGAAWDRVLSDFGTNSEDKVEVRKAYQKTVEDYKRRHIGSDFLDGPHFEWVK